MSWSDPGWLAFAGLALAGAATTPLLARWRTLQQARLASRPLWLRWFGAAPATGSARLALWLLAAAAAATAAAGPRWGRAGTVADEGVSAAIALDESASMRCADVHPDRIVVATDVLRQAIEHTPRATWALAVGAGDARPRVPLTGDANTVVAALADRSLGAGLTPGSNLALLLATAASMLEGGGPARAIILVSDGDSFDLAGGNDESIAQTLRKDNITVYSIHISSGDPPPPIVTITGMTGGEVFPVDDPQALQAVFRRIDEMKATKLEKTAPEVLDHFAPFCMAGLSLLGATGLCHFGLRYTPW